jgi:eukaryotic-like serine/threonine-protein kinase
MALSSGTKLGPYEIQSQLGAGGMGEVYRALDTRLDRTVAVKILPTHLSDNPDLKQRFEREARAISALSHPNICHLYDVGSQDGLDYLVMEYLEGQNLAERLRKGPLPLEQVARIGMEIADALEKAHRQGIIHRDLKPANIMLTKAGAKLMDFGVAKPVGLAGAAGGSAPPTLTRSEPLTQQGMVIGTMQYMAPEQLEGKPADPPCDIFALGCVLYEMATGRAAFAGASPASVVAAILASEPTPITAVQPAIPATLDQVIRTALAKNPDDRWQSAQDVKLQLKWIGMHAADTLAAQPQGRGRFRPWLPWAIILVLLIVTGLLAVRNFESRTLAVQLTRSSILPPARSSFVAHNFAISPDGRHLAFVAIGEDGHNNLWVRSLNSARAQQLAGTEGANYPFWSADSGSLGFFADGKLKTVELGGGALRVLCDAAAGRGGTWNRDGIIVFAPLVVGPLKSVSASGGTPVPVTKMARQGSGQGHRWPWFLPDGRHFLLLVDWSSPADQQEDGIYVGSLDSQDVKLVSADITGSAAYSSGRLIFVRNRSLMAQPFDLARLQLTGSPAPLIEEELEKDPAFSDSNFSLSPSGPIVFYSAVDAASELLWFDRNGNQIGRVPGSGFSDPRLSPDGRFLAVSYDSAKNGQYSIYIYDLARGLMTRLTEGGSELYPVWSADGKKIVYVSATGKEYRVYEIPADRSGPPKLLIQGAKMIPNDWSPDGKYLIYMDFEKGLPYLAMYSAADGSRRQLLAGAEGQFSPDGQWIAHVEAGTYSEIWVQRFPGGSRLQISAGGGAQARWSRNGTELFYMAGDRKLMEVKFDSKTNTPGPPQTLFQTRVIAPNFTIRQYDVTSDGKHFIVNSLPPAGTVPLTLLTSWTAESGR